MAFLPYSTDFSVTSYSRAFLGAKRTRYGYELLKKDAGIGDHPVDILRGSCLHPG